MDLLDNQLFDVVIVGYGPVGRMLALKLGLRGHRVLVVERKETVYFLPRAVHLDDEASRILQSVGLPPSDLPETIGPYDDFYEWRAADRSTLLKLDWRGRGPSGWNVSNFFYQPDLERALAAKVDALPNVDIVLGARAVDRAEFDNLVEVTLQFGGGATQLVRGRYVVGADGANSVVRDWIGTTESDLGYFHDWLVVDLIMKSDRVTFDPPAWQLCDPARPTTLVPGGPGRRRFEFMRLPQETAAELNREDTAWALLEPWGITPDDADLERHTIYTFQAKWADSWQRDRLLLVGDAAHLMPPFAGQGMCSGLRDAVNLAWKLDFVLAGTAQPTLLESYSSERIEHVRHFIAASMALGDVICITETDAAADRDARMRDGLASGVEMPPRPLPRLGKGVHRADAGGGLLAVQGLVDAGAGPQLFDDAIGGGGYLLLDNATLVERIGPLEADALAAHGITIVTLAGSTGPARVVDFDGVHQRWLTELGAVAVLVRPDFYVFGVAADALDLTSLVDDFLVHFQVAVA